MEHGIVSDIAICIIAAWLVAVVSQFARPEGSGPAGPQIAREFFPMHQAFLGHGIHCTQFWREHFDRHDPHYWFFANLEDPNERGHDVIRRLFLQEIAKTRNSYR